MRAAGLGWHMQGLRGCN